MTMTSYSFLTLILFLFMYQICTATECNHSCSHFLSESCKKRLSSLRPSPVKIPFIGQPPLHLLKRRGLFGVFSRKKEDDEYEDREDDDDKDDDDDDDDDDIKYKIIKEKCSSCSSPCETCEPCETFKICEPSIATCITPLPPCPTEPTCKPCAFSYIMGKIRHWVRHVNHAVAFFIRQKNSLQKVFPCIQNILQDSGCCATRGMVDFSECIKEAITSAHALMECLMQGTNCELNKTVDEVAQVNEEISTCASSECPCSCLMSTNYLGLFGSIGCSLYESITSLVSRTSFIGSAIGNFSTIASQLSSDVISCVRLSADRAELLDMEVEARLCSCLGLKMEYTPPRRRHPDGRGIGNKRKGGGNGEGEGNGDERGDGEEEEEMEEETEYHEYDDYSENHIRHLEYEEYEDTDYERRK